MTTTKAIFDGQVTCSDCGRPRHLRVVTNAPSGGHTVPVATPLTADWQPHDCAGPAVDAPPAADPRVSQPQ